MYLDNSPGVYEREKSILNIFLKKHNAYDDFWNSKAPPVEGAICNDETYIYILNNWRNDKFVPIMQYVFIWIYDNSQNWRKLNRKFIKFRKTYVKCIGISKLI